LVIDSDDRVFNVIENGLKLTGRVLFHFARKRGGLIRHELHRTHDATAFGVHPLIGGRYLGE
jgi:hypothetical protein